MSAPGWLLALAEGARSTWALHAIAVVRFAGIVLVLAVVLLLAWSAGLRLHRRWSNRRDAFVGAKVDRWLPSLLVGGEQAALAAGALASLPGRPAERRLLHYLRLLDGADRERVVWLLDGFGVSLRAHRQLKDRRWWRRLEGARLLDALATPGPSGDAAALQLLPLLHDREPAVRSAAATAIGRVGGPPARAGVARSDRRGGGVGPILGSQVLLGLGARATPAICALLDQPLRDPVEIARGTLALGVLAHHGDATSAAAIVRALAHPQPQIRRAALVAAARRRLAQALEGAIRATTDPDASLRLEALRLLAALGDVATIPSLRAALVDPAFPVQLAAAEALAAFGTAGQTVLADVAGLWGRGAEVSRRALDECRGRDRALMDFERGLSAMGGGPDEPAPNARSRDAA